jgi:uncharacterized BrkB/YihY/UPF0761 family membrane protein
MNRVKRAVHAADALQQRHAWLAVPVAVWKKFGDDQAGNLAALIAYYSFVAIFPLLLVLVTVLDLVLKNDPGLQHLRGGDRPAGLAVPGGGADPVRGAD